MAKQKESNACLAIRTTEHTTDGVDQLLAPRSYSLDTILPAKDVGLARRVELVLAVRREHAPVRLVLRLAVVANALGLPRLVKGLEVEDVHAPLEHAAHALLVEGLGVLGAGDRRAVVAATVCTDNMG